jgi:hypothetical protein
MPVVLFHSKTIFNICKHGIIPYYSLSQQSKIICLSVCIIMQNFSATDMLTKTKLKSFKLATVTAPPYHSWHWSDGQGKQMDIQFDDVVLQSCGAM